MWVTIAIGGVCLFWGLFMLLFPRQANDLNTRIMSERARRADPRYWWNRPSLMIKVTGTVLVLIGVGGN
jgi:uncharacterized protein YjeT (DUF2065 family)